MKEDFVVVRIECACPKSFEKAVQRYLDEGYTLRGETFVTKVTYHKTVVEYYNQILVRYNNSEK